MVLEQQLRVPGPTPIPERVVRAASRPMINHRGPEFAELITELVENLRWALQTNGEILFFPASGTGGLEAAAANLLSPGERALFCTMGSFGERWADMATAFGADVVRLDVPWGESIDPEDVDSILADHADITKVFVTHNETSTGVCSDIAALAAVVKGRGKLLAVDSVSGAGMVPLDMDGSGIDVLVTASQKGWLAPPGLAMVAVSPAGMAAAAQARCPRWYFDFAREKAMQDRRQTYTTPPVTVMFALQEGLRIMREEGRENVWARHRRVATMVRAGLRAIGLRLFAAETCRSDTVTAVRSPAGSPEETARLLETLRTRYGLVLAGGQERLAGRLLRVGHMGMVDERDAYSILATVEQALCDHGLLSRVGLCVAAAQAAVRESTAAPEPAAVG